MVTVSFRIEDDLKERLDRVAEDRGLNVSNVFRQALTEKLLEIEPKEESGGRNLSLTIKDRLMLVLQLRTLRALCPKEEKKSIEAEIEALQSGYEYHYPDLIVAFDNGLSRRACVEVLDILEMHSELRWGFQKLKDKNGLKEEDIWFFGFDGNQEVRQWAYAKYFMFDLGRYESLHEQAKQNDCNSHCPMLDVYRRMLNVFRTYKHPMVSLSASAIKAIIAARRE